MRIELEGGKYIYEQDERGSRVLRYGEPWRDLTGDKFIGALVDEIARLRASESWAAKVAAAKARLGRDLTVGELMLLAKAYTMTLAKAYTMTPEEIAAQRESWERQDKH